MENTTYLNSICVLILNYQSYQDTIDYVQCLQKQENIQVNILIVDNCSPNCSFDILKSTFRDVKNIKVIVSERNGGYAYGNNFGLHYLEKEDIDYILISNNDIEIKDPLLLCKMVERYKTLKNPAFVSPIMHINGMQSPHPAWKIPTLKEDVAGSLRILALNIDTITTYAIQSGKNSMLVDCLPGSFFMGRKDIFYKIGLMDDKTFLYMEEAILAYKVKINNLNNYLFIDLKYEHMTSQTISNELSQIKMRKHLIDSRIYFHKKYLQTNIFGQLLLKFGKWKLFFI